MAFQLWRQRDDARDEAFSKCRSASKNRLIGGLRNAEHGIGKGGVDVCASSSRGASLCVTHRF
jgi:hypothetical protein